MPASSSTTWRSRWAAKAAAGRTWRRRAVPNPPKSRPRSARCASGWSSSFESDRLEAYPLLFRRASVVDVGDVDFIPACELRGAKRVHDGAAHLPGRELRGPLLHLLREPFGEVLDHDHRVGVGAVQNGLEYFSGLGVLPLR